MSTPGSHTETGSHLAPTAYSQDLGFYQRRDGAPSTMTGRYSAPTPTHTHPARPRPLTPIPIAKKPWSPVGVNSLNSKSAMLPPVPNNSPDNSSAVHARSRDLRPDSWRTLVEEPGESERPEEPQRPQQPEEQERVDPLDIPAINPAADFSRSPPRIMRSHSLLGMLMARETGHRVRTRYHNSPVSYSSPWFEFGQRSPNSSTDGQFPSLSSSMSRSGSGCSFSGGLEMRRVRSRNRYSDQLYERTFLEDLELFDISYHTKGW
ncbi:hypothetical protein F4777DRAFT_600801 [Nemania sp. FL0916]|nr:hypothetical protein F4777DRAFT_600801 [Nemania sp. FL0916]